MTRLWGKSVHVIPSINSVVASRHDVILTAHGHYLHYRYAGTLSPYLDDLARAIKYGERLMTG